MTKRKATTSFREWKIIDFSNGLFGLTQRRDIGNSGEVLIAESLDERRRR
jgi:hypothetical protein